MRKMILSIASGAAFLIFFAAGFAVSLAPAYAQIAGSANPSIDIVPAVLPDGVAGTPYSATISVATVAASPFYWTLTAGTPPPGLSLGTASTGPSIILSGTPASTGQFTFTVSATNHDVAAMRTYVMNVIGVGATDLTALATSSVASIATSTAPATNTLPATNAASTSMSVNDIQSELDAAVAELQQVLVQISGTPGVPNSGGTAAGGTVLGATDCGTVAFCRDLSVGSRGADVLSLQEFLNAHGAAVAASGPGSPGNETTFFGERTRLALVEWQTANGITPADGFFGPKTRAAIEAMTITAPTGTAPAAPSGLGTSSMGGIPPTTSATSAPMAPSPSQSQNY